MAYNPSLYNPYGLQTNANQVNAFANPVNGLVQVDSEEDVRMFQLPPNSISPPLFLASDNIFFVKTTDRNGMAITKRYRFDEEPDSNGSDFVTKSDLHQFKTEILEAIHGQYTVPEQPSSEQVPE